MHACHFHVKHFIAVILYIWRETSKAIVFPDTRHLLSKCCKSFGTSIGSCTKFSKVSVKYLKLF